MSFLLTTILLTAGQDEKGIQALVERLGDVKIEARESAMRELRRIGKPALPALRKAANSRDAETALRAKQLIEDIDWPDPGEPSNGIALAIKARPDYERQGEILIRGRLINVSKASLAVEGAAIAEVGEDGPFGLVFDKGEELHLCYHRKEPAPDLLPKVTLGPGEAVDFTFSPRAWCCAVEHSKCQVLQVAPGEHEVALTLTLASGKEAWSGTAKSNAVRFAVRE